jgi:hypothetical protein
MNICQSCNYIKEFRWNLDKYYEITEWFCFDKRIGEGDVKYLKTPVWCPVYDMKMLYRHKKLERILK